MRPTRRCTRPSATAATASACSRARRASTRSAATSRWPTPAGRRTPDMRWIFSLIIVAATMCAAPADEKPKPWALTPKQAADGWLMIFDGETTFGWKIDGDAKVEDGKLILGGTKATTAWVTTELTN